MAGNVYIFNTTTTELSLILNNTIVSSTLAGVTQTNSYAPTSINLARNPATNPETDQFGSTNTLVVSFESTGGGSASYDINIPTSTYPLQTDLQLYIFYNIVVLEISTTGSGTPIDQQTSQIVLGTRLSDKQAAAIKSKAKAS